MNDRENIQLPQALPCLAAVLLKEGFSVKVIDCFPKKIGWGSLKKIITLEKPDIVCISESEFLWGHEGIKVARLTKKINSTIVTIAGGLYFSTKEKVPRCIDFIIIGEGEITLVELVKELQKLKNKQKLHKIKGLMYKKSDNKIVKTSPRPLIKNLDTLPFPAYQLMDMKYYIKDKINWNLSLVTIHHSRGCNQGCNFCSCWLQMAQRNLKNGKEVLIPKWRTKSVKRIIAELEFLNSKYNCKKFEFTDDTWNLDPEWNKQFADAIKNKGLKIQWASFLRLDYILRDEKTGVLKKLVDSGLIHIYTGIERDCDEDFKKMGKEIYKKHVTTEALRIIRNKYPYIFIHGSFIFGVDSETRGSMIRIAEYAKNLDIDHFGAFLLTPIKGTRLWEEANKKNLIEVKNLRCYDWYTPVMPSKNMSREELEETCNELNPFTDKFWLSKDIKSIFLPYKYRRDKHLYFLKLKFKISLDRLKENLGLKTVLDNKDKFAHGVKPSWYYD